MHGDTVAIVTGDRVNLRGRPTLSSEVVAQVLEGETVVVLDSLELRPSRRGEVVQWHKIRLPEDTPVWVHAGFIDRTTKTVTASRLNVRAGPGDRYSILGHLAKDESVREIRIVDDWMEIAPPSGTYAYMAASYAALQPAAVSATGPHTAKTAPAATPPSVAKSVAASPHRARETPAASMIQPTASFASTCFPCWGSPAPRWCWTFRSRSSSPPTGLGIWSRSWRTPTATRAESSWQAAHPLCRS